ncbi:hypothetical protein AB3X52_13315 [Nocardioides sp. DS6]|uniref:CobQ/CobB/MinD/ParA nucleotide binding domain-containing protein n=1 Tax=Nocardioides eburneus TaxID=3231482 RepID=A0ABV3T089_9ACTN
MSDDRPGPDETPAEQPDLAVRRRQRAQGAAADLARMGIDPRSLGLSGDAAPGATEEPPSSVVPLRPDIVPPPYPPAPPEPAAGVPGGLPGQAVASAPSPEETVTVPPAERAVPVARTDPGRLLRSVARGIATPDAAASIQDERALVEAVRRRQSDRRVVAFVAGKGGVGCTTVAVGVGQTMAALREDHSVLVDVQTGALSLGRLLGGEQNASGTALLAHHEAVDPPRLRSGLGVVDAPDWEEPLGRREVGRLLELLGSAHAFTLFDVGDDAGDGAHSALARADQVVAVTGPGSIGAEALARVHERIGFVNPVAARAVVNVVVCPHDDAYRQTQREIGGAGPSFVVVPPERALRAGTPFDPAVVGAATRQAILRVAASMAMAPS